MLASNDWFEQIKYYVHSAIDQKISVVEGLVTSRQLNPPSVKVMIQPYNIETGWIRIGVPYGGNGFGFLAIPPEGQAVKVLFDMGDKSSSVVVCDLYNNIDVPPTLNNIDDVVFQHKSGANLYFTSNGQVEVNSANGQSIVFNGGAEGVARVGDTVDLNTQSPTYSKIISGSTNIKA